MPRRRQDFRDLHQMLETPLAWRRTPTRKSDDHSGVATGMMPAGTRKADGSKPSKLISGQMYARGPERPRYVQLGHRRPWRRRISVAAVHTRIYALVLDDALIHVLRYCLLGCSWLVM